MNTGFSAQPSTRPENAESRARELLSISQPQAALDLLTQVLSSRRHKTWSPVHEVLMKLYLDICVDLTLTRELKDGLHQYRNLCQVQAPNSLEVVILYLLELVGKIPTGEGSQEVVFEQPSALLKQTRAQTNAAMDSNIKFVSEAHRSILDILKTHSKLAHVYQATASTALDFLSDLGRKSDFKRLCEFLRSHLSNLQRYGSKTGASDSKSMRNWDGWSDSAMGAILQIKLKILTMCQKLNIPSEIYRTLEDIHAMRKLGNRLQLTNVMAEGSPFCLEYHSILSSVCLVNGDYYIVGLLLEKLLDHELAKPETARDMQRVAELANTVTFCTICSPSKPTSRQVKLIHLIHNLVRLDLVDAIEQNGYIQFCDSGLQELYDINNSIRLLQVNNLGSLLEEVKAAKIVNFDNTEQPDLQVPLRNTLATKYLKMLSKYYSVVKISSLVAKFDGVIGQGALEKIMVDVGKVDWRNDSLRFQPPSNKDWVVNLAKSLSKVQIKPAPAINFSYFEDIKAGLEDENKAAVSRKNVIEQEKEEAERKQMEAAMEDAAKKEAEKAKRDAEEKRRLALEEKRRELEKQKKIQEELENNEKKKYLAALGQSADEVNADLTVEELALKHQEKLAKKKAKQEKELSLRLKKLDFTTRAIRDEEMKIIKARQEESLAKHREMYEKDIVQKAEQDKKDWEIAIERKNALSSLDIFKFTGEFEAKVAAREQSNYEAIKMQCDKDAEQLAKAQKLKRAKKRKEDEIKEQREAERKAELEAIRLEKEKEIEAKRAKEEEARKKEEERMRALEEKKLAEDRQRSSSDKYVPPMRANRFGDRDSDRGSGGNRFGDRPGDSGSGGKYVPPAMRSRVGSSRSSETPRENSRWR